MLSVARPHHINFTTCHHHHHHHRYLPEFSIIFYDCRSVSPSSSITEASISPGCEVTSHYPKDEGTDFTKWRNFVTPVYNIYSQNQILSQQNPESAFHHPPFMTGKTVSESVLHLSPIFLFIWLASLSICYSLFTSPSRRTLFCACLLL